MRFRFLILKVAILALNSSVDTIRILEWMSIVLSPMVSRVVFRTTNRFLVGLPLCKLSTTRTSDLSIWKCQVETPSF